MLIPFTVIFCAASSASNVVLALTDSVYQVVVERDDVTVYYIPATRLASENGFPTLANMIIAGKVLNVIGEFNEESITATLRKIISAKRFIAGSPRV